LVSINLSQADRSERSSGIDADDKETFHAEKMKSVLVWLNLFYIHAVLSRISFPKNVFIEIPTTIEGNLECRYLGIKPNFSSQEALEWVDRELPGYQKFVTEQIKLSEEERKKKPPAKIPKTEEILEKLGSWGHYYDWGTKEIASWERKNPPAPNQLPLVDHYKTLKEAVLEKQKLRREGKDGTELPPEMIKQKEELR
jgi:hypothetical protein